MSLGIITRRKCRYLQQHRRARGRHAQRSRLCAGFPWLANGRTHHQPQKRPTARLCVAVPRRQGPCLVSVCHTAGLRTNALVQKVWGKSRCYQGSLQAPGPHGRGPNRVALSSHHPPGHMPGPWQMRLMPQGRDSAPTLLIEEQPCQVGDDPAMGTPGRQAIWEGQLSTPGDLND